MKSASSKSASSTALTPIISLNLTILKAEKLPVADITTSDPYIICKLDNSFLYRTKTITANLNPVWNEYVTNIPLFHRNSFLKLEIYDRDLKKDDDILGFVTIPLRDFIVDDDFMTSDTTIVNDEISKKDNAVKNNMKDLKKKKNSNERVYEMQNLGSYRSHSKIYAEISLFSSNLFTVPLQPDPETNKKLCDNLNTSNPHSHHRIELSSQEIGNLRKQLQIPLSQLSLSSSQSLINQNTVENLNLQVERFWAFLETSLTFSGLFYDS